ncbi:hypothetical protein ACKVWC_010803 [Pyricularia oryzae]
MASVLLAAGAARSIAAIIKTPPTNEAVSGVFGSISLTAWICLLLPQLITNYKTKSAEGLSMAFLIVWLLGDLANLLGALATRLAPTAVALAVYFCFADVVLITQCVYYNALTARREARLNGNGNAETQNGASRAVEDEPDEEEPLLSRRRRSSLAGLPGSQRRHSSMARDVSNLDPLARCITGEDETPDAHPWLHNTLSLVAVYVVGTAGFFVSYGMGAWGDHTDAPEIPEAGDAVTAFGLTMGYVSAALYLLARLPQIYKNYKEKSCEGLALLFFMLSLTGNLTYGVSLVAYSQEKSYIIKTIPWLLGSLGTIVEDIVIFFQFRLYSTPKESSKSSDENESTA